MTWSNYISTKSQKWLEHLFYKFGVAVYHRPIVFFITGIVMTAVFMLGFLNSSYENRPTYLWIPDTSEIFQNYQKIINDFSEFDDDVFLLMVEQDGNNLLTPENMDAMFEVYLTTIYNITSEYDKVEYTFQDLCAREYEGYAECDALTENLFYLFGNDRDNWQSQDDIQYVLDNFADAAAWFVGAEIFDEELNKTIGGSIVRISLYLQGSKSTKEENINTEWMLTFEDYWKERETKYKVDNNFLIRYFTDASFGPELDRIVSADLPVFFAAFAVMLTYLSITLGEFSCVGARPLVAIGCLLSIIFALLFGIGLGSAFGIPLNTIVLLIPFIMLGVGVDDDIIIAEALKKTPLPENDRNRQDERFGNALKHAGLSITLTSLASIIAFSVGSTVDIPGIKSFCLFAAFCFLGNYILQLFIYVPILTWDERRMWSNRNFCLCCIKHENATVNAIEMTLAVGMTSGVSTKGSIAAIAHTSDRTTTGGNDSSSDQSGNCAEIRSKLSMDYLLINGLAKLIDYRAARIAIFMFFAGLLTASFIAFPSLSRESDPTKVMPDDSFVIDFFDTVDEGFGQVSFGVLDIVITNCDFSQQDERDQVLLMIDSFDNDFESNYGSLSGNISHWLNDFNNWVIDYTDDNITVNDITDSQYYYSLLQQFTNDTEYRQWDAAIIYNNEDNPTKVKATRFQVFIDFDFELTRRWKFVVDLEDNLDDTLGSKNGFTFAIYFLYAYLADVIVILTVENLGFAALGVVLVLFILMDIKISIMILFMILMIDVDLIGWMILNDIDLDSLSYSQVVMAVGLTVDYVIHISHAIVNAKPNDSVDYKERLSIAFHEMGVGVAKGAFTTFLGTMTLIFSQSEAFRTFFVMFCGIIIIAVLHGFLLIPALLAEMPFMYNESCCGNDKNNNNNNNNLNKNKSTSEMSATSGKSQGEIR